LANAEHFITPELKELLLKALAEFQRLGLRLKETETKNLLGLAA
jgi:hypothetical protein